MLVATATYYVSMSPGGLWHLASGTCELGYGYIGNFNSNQGSLTIDSGAALNCWDFGSSTNTNLNVHALSGSGTLTKTNYSGTVNLTVGVAGGSGTFGGLITNTRAP